MQKIRRHERFALTADVTIQPGDENPDRFVGKVFNASRGGVAVFSQQVFPPGRLAGLELSLAAPGEPEVRLTLFGITRWVQTEPDGNLLGIELLADGRAGDYRRFIEIVDRRQAARHARGGFTLIETCIAMTIVCLLVTLAVPTFKRALEQARADAALANLKTLWSAQRVYWLECRSYSADLSLLRGMDLIDPAVASSSLDPKAVYVYQIAGADQTGFVATATRHNGGVWSGQLSLDQEGTVTGAIAGPGGQVLTPAQ